MSDGFKDSKIVNGDIFRIDTYDVQQYENERIVDTVTVIDESKNLDRKKWILCQSPKLFANILVARHDLKDKVE